MASRTAKRSGRKDLRALFWASGGVFLATALATYTTSDPSFNSKGKIATVHNAIGVVGSFTSDALYQVLGLAAWSLVGYALRRAYLIRTGQESQQPIWLRASLGLAMTLVFSGLLSLHFGNSPTVFREVTPGGVLGTMLNRILQIGLNPVGIGILLWTSAIALLMSQKEESKIATQSVPLWVRGWRVSLAGISWSAAQMWAGLGRGYRWLTEAPAQDRSEKAEPEVAELQAKPAPVLTAPEDRDTEQADYDESAMPTPAPVVASKEELAPKRRQVKMQAQVNRTVENWKLPDLALLEDPPASRIKIDKREIELKAQTIVDKLEKFDVGGEVVAAKPGPAVTLFEFRPNADVQLSQVTSRADDLALALSAESLRIIAPIPGRDVVGIETSNAQRETVYLKDILADQKFWKAETPLPICMGREVDGTPRVVDLRSMPHMMVAGQTGSGKSVFVVSSIVGFIYRHSPKTLRVVLIDPKQVDLTLFNQIPHLLMPPICEAKKAVQALRWGVREMEKRNRSFNRFKVRKLEEFNEAVRKLSREQIEEHAAVNAELEEKNRRSEQYYFQELPFIVYVIEEFGDLMMVDKQHVEEGVVRLTQMARAAGIHLILAMQTPRKEIVTGRIKTNIPGRVSFKVPGLLDSKIILDEKGAERLLGKGDLLFMAPGVSKAQRHHAPWLTNEEIEKVVGHWSKQGEPQYDELAMRTLEGTGTVNDGPGGDPGASGLDFDDDSGGDEMYDQILAWVASQRTVSASLIQRKFGLGYPRASRLIDQFERAGVIGPNNGSKPRQVLVQPMPQP